MIVLDGCGLAQVRGQESSGWLASWCWRGRCRWSAGRWLGRGGLSPGRGCRRPRWWQGSRERTGWPSSMIFRGICERCFIAWQASARCGGSLARGSRVARVCACHPVLSGTHSGPGVSAISGVWAAMNSYSPFISGTSWRALMAHSQSWPQVSSPRRIAATRSVRTLFSRGLGSALAWSCALLGEALQHVFSHVAHRLLLCEGLGGVHAAAQPRSRGIIGKAYAPPKRVVSPCARTTGMSGGRGRIDPRVRPATSPVVAPHEPSARTAQPV